MDRVDEYTPLSIHSSGERFQRDNGWTHSFPPSILPRGSSKNGSKMTKKAPALPPPSTPPPASPATPPPPLHHKSYNKKSWCKNCEKSKHRTELKNNLDNGDINNNDDDVSINNNRNVESRNDTPGISQMEFCSCLSNIPLIMSPTMTQPLIVHPSQHQLLLNTQAPLILNQRSCQQHSNISNQQQNNVSNVQNNTLNIQQQSTTVNSILVVSSTTFNQMLLSNLPVISSILLTPSSHQNFTLACLQNSSNQQLVNSSHSASLHNLSTQSTTSSLSNNNPLHPHNITSLTSKPFCTNEYVSDPLASSTKHENNLQHTKHIYPIKQYSPHHNLLKQEQQKCVKSGFICRKCQKCRCLQCRKVFDSATNENNNNILIEQRNNSLTTHSNNGRLLSNHQPRKLSKEESSDVMVRLCADEESGFVTQKVIQHHDTTNREDKLIINCSSNNCSWVRRVISNLFCCCYGNKDRCLSKHRNEGCQCSDDDDDDDDDILN